MGFVGSAQRADQEVNVETYNALVQALKILDMARLSLVNTPAWATLWHARLHLQAQAEAEYNAIIGKEEAA